MLLWISEEKLNQRASFAPNILYAIILIILILIIIIQSLITKKMVLYEIQKVS